MKWFRSNIRHGSRLALFALALQFALSFGHFHRAAAQAAPALQSGSAQSGLSNVKNLSPPDAVNKAAEQQPGSDTDRQPSDACAICAVIALANSVLFAAPPSLPLPQAIESPHLTAGAEFVQLYAARVAFQPRAPPAS
jgi:uncharacterized iron-regulated membrane protein